MIILHPLSDFINPNTEIITPHPSYYYEGKCPQTGELLKLPRTALVEAIAKRLMQQLSENQIYTREGKMYGVLLVELPNGEPKIIKAFSGLLNGYSVVKGWVPPIPGREEVALAETQTLAKLAEIKQEIITLKQIPERQQYETLTVEFKQQLQIMNLQHNQSKQQRQEKRQQYQQTLRGETLEIAIAQLEAESCQQGIERKYLKRRQNELLQPLAELITAADNRIRELKQQRKELSRQLQTQMHAAYSLTNFYGQSLSLQQLIPGGIPTGTGECCAPKLLHYAATHKLKPLAMAEFWWGESSIQDKVQGEFYGACVERCQPLMGFLLSGLKSQTSDFQKLEIIYEDQWLIAVNKPPGLLSVPGRYHYNQDSVLSRLRNLYDLELMTVHRLDQETSGILILARDSTTHSQLNQQFAKRQIHKIYEAVLAGSLTTDQGIIDLPLWGNPENRPYQTVDLEKGKPSLTNFRVIGKQGNHTRVEFIPLTGRTHQLRVHAADVRGLGVKILGDRLYGCNANVSRLHLHSREITFQHPHTGETLHLQTKTPF
ncbi:RluA family pseudouridine synthase [Anabaena sphaerica FACHB-251]|uniref:RNA pseudouridylate synthase n=1 Tax=Anabaena sphaerica FACHB-251 TaxID=2692883 RepID=A0A926WH71_9NOST|nr:RluA family pseudouridine synthase [Anabaena sphaerica]MBD2293411.1 RluA family pseudouridine synthase [Anabaena sphaerica FACHB-251]